MPSANTPAESGPANGRRASAAYAEAWISVMPRPCRTAAAVTMMASATRFANVMPTSVSTLIR